MTDIERFREPIIHHSRIRCTNSERDTARNRLSHWYGEGALDDDELAARQYAIDHAETRDELANLMRDLPPPPGPPPSPPSLDKMVKKNLTRWPGFVLADAGLFALGPGMMTWLIAGTSTFKQNNAPAGYVVIFVLSFLGIIAWVLFNILGSIAWADHKRKQKYR